MAPARWSLVAAALVYLSGVQASRTPFASTLSTADGISVISASEVSTFKPYTVFAATAYCEPASTLNWTCGQDCEFNSEFRPVASGGDGAFMQFWYVGYDPILDDVIVSHQGTDVLKIVPVLTDGDTVVTQLDTALFPSAPSSVFVHAGFAEEQEQTASAVLAAVQDAMAHFGTNKVTTVGHSLGAAISLLDAIFLHLQLPNAVLRYVGYGSPRVGSDTFADWVDTLSIEVHHIANKKDLVPILPPEALGFRHVSGEIHIDESNEWMDCPGHDNPSSFCTAGDVSLLLDFSLADHTGPYDGVMMECP